MGLFSAPATLDLSRLEEASTGEIAPGVHLISTPQKNRKDRNKSATNAVPTHANVVPEVPTHQPQLPSHRTYYAQLNLHHVNYTLSQGFSASLEGFASVSANADLRIETPSDEFYLFTSRFSKVDWKAKDAAALPYQNSISTHSLIINGLYGEKSWDWCFGAHFEMLPLLKREALEKVKNVDVFIAGPAMGYSSVAAKNLYYNAIAALAYGGQVTSVIGFNKLNYQLSHSVYLGGDLDFNIFFGANSLSGFYLTTGLHIGREW